MSKIDRLTCEQVFRRLDDFVDRELTQEETRLVQEHLETCVYCAAEYKFQESVIREVRSRLQHVSAPADLLAKVSAILKSAQAVPGE